MKGPINAPIAFVGAVSSDIDKARREPITGPAGYILKKLYLKPLRLDRDDVLIGNIDGNPKAIKDHIESLQTRPFVIALSQSAKKQLGEDFVDFVLPHPDVVSRLGDSGEVSRKMRRVKKILRKQEQLGSEGGELLTNAAESSWNNNWHKSFPENGQGRFVYQRHWKDLTEEESLLGDMELLRSGRMLHGDLRLEAKRGLIGWAVMLGRAGENRGLATGDKFIAGQTIPGIVKPPHSTEWLNVAKDSGQVFDPGEVGATPEAFGKVFTRDLGIYKIGVVRQDSVELFLDGRELSGRYLISRGGSDPRTPWQVRKPEDQSPFASRSTVESTIDDLRGADERFLIWSSPSSEPQRIDVKTGSVIKSKEVSIFKADEDKKIVYGIVLDPYQPGGGDAHGDYISPREIERTAHQWMKKSRLISLNHEQEAKGAFAVESWVEQYPSRKDYIAAQKGEPHRAFRREYGADVLHSGAWILGTQLTDELWDDFKRGEIEAYSIEGFGVRVPMSREELPDVTFVDLVGVSRDVQGA